MKREDFFSPEENSFDFRDIESLIKFTRYKPNDQSSFIEGMELAEDLTTNAGILYTKGTEITPDRISRLGRILENNPNLELPFKIKRSGKLIQKFRNDIKADMTKLLKKKAGTKSLEHLIFQIGSDIEKFIDEILSEENVTLAIYQMKFLCESAEKSKSTLFYNHSLNVMLITIALSKSSEYSKLIDDDKNKLIEISKLSLFHNYGAIREIHKILKYDEQEWFKLYWDANQIGFISLKKFQMGFEILDAIRFLCEYHTTGKRDFLTGTDWPSTMANVVLVSEAFIQRESGLFGMPQQAREIADFLNVKAMEKEYNSTAVKALTLGMNLMDLFDFYQRLDIFSKKCLFNLSGVPYPLIGFKSPTLYVCKNEVTQCQHIEKSLYAVTLVKPLGELQPKKYRQCWLLSNMLLTFYKEHYKDIKESATEKQPLPKQ